MCGFHGVLFPGITALNSQKTGMPKIWKSQGFPDPGFPANSTTSDTNHIGKITGETGYCNPDIPKTTGGNDILQKDPSRWGFCDTSIARCNSNSTRKQYTSDKLQKVSLRMLTKKKCKDKLAKTKNFDEHHEMCTVGLYKRKYRTVTITQTGNRQNNFEWKFELGDMKETKELFGKERLVSCFICLSIYLSKY